MSWSVFVLPVPVAPDQPVAIEHRQGDADLRGRVGDALVHHRAQRQRGAGGLVGGGDPGGRL
jgi:hypothetical protein